MQNVLDPVEKRAKKPRKEQIVYRNEDQIAIGKYTAENKNASAQMHFKKKFPELGESTVRSFKQTCLSLIASGKSNITSIPTKCIGRPLVFTHFTHFIQ